VKQSAQIVCMFLFDILNADFIVQQLGSSRNSDADFEKTSIE